MQTRSFIGMDVHKAALVQTGRVNQQGLRMKYRAKVCGWK